MTLNAFVPKILGTKRNAPRAPLRQPGGHSAARAGCSKSNPAMASIALDPGTKH